MLHIHYTYMQITYVINNVRKPSLEVSGQFCNEMLLQIYFSVRIAELLISRDILQIILVCEKYQY